jgi:hypothetical protein
LSPGILPHFLNQIPRSRQIHVDSFFAPPVKADGQLCLTSLRVTKDLSSPAFLAPADARSITSEKRLPSGQVRRDDGVHIRKYSVDRSAARASLPVAIKVCLSGSTR